MTNEIKEILDEMKEVALYSTASDLVRELDSKDCMILLNYITNLQQRIDKSIELIDKEDVHIFRQLDKNRYISNFDTTIKVELLNILRGDE